MQRATWEGRGSPRPCDLRSGHSVELKQAWAELLGRWSWEWFCTLTFARVNVHPEQADKCWRVWIAMTNREVYGRNYNRRGKGVRWVRALEFQQRGAIHFHALLAGVKRLRRLTMMDRWEKLAGFARVEAVREQERARKYVAKYVAKNCEIEVGGPGLVVTPGLELF